MDIVKSYSARCFFWIFFFMALLCLLLDGALYIALDYLALKLPEVLGMDITLNELRAPLEIITQFYIPVTAGIFLFTALLMWLCCRVSLTKLVKKHVSVPKAEEKPKKSPEAEHKERERSDQRLFLHLISVLQREGRLLDFLSENLEEYDDSDIGAAVRDIHEKSKKALEKYLTADAVVETEEDGLMTVEPGFDPNAVKLTGNVVGEPPFKGIVRHRGWKVKKLEMPVLSGTKDTKIIAPAEVEIE
ncbi:MAG: DUF2760 domain-containing protein [Desulfococcaceae bacterium]